MSEIFVAAGWIWFSTLRLPPEEPDKLLELGAWLCILVGKVKSGTAVAGNGTAVVVTVAVGEGVAVEEGVVVGVALLVGIFVIVAGGGDVLFSVGEAESVKLSLNSFVGAAKAAACRSPATIMGSDIVGKRDTVLVGDGLANIPALLPALNCRPRVSSGLFKAKIRASLVSLMSQAPTSEITVIKKRNKIIPISKGQNLLVIGTSSVWLYLVQLSN